MLKCKERTLSLQPCVEPRTWAWSLDLLKAQCDFRSSRLCVNNNSCEQRNCYALHWPNLFIFVHFFRRFYRLLWLFTVITWVAPNLVCFSDILVVCIVVKSRTERCFIHYKCWRMVKLRAICLYQPRFQSWDQTSTPAWRQHRFITLIDNLTLSFDINWTLTWLQTNAVPNKMKIASPCWNKIALSLRVICRIWQQG